MNLWFCFSRAQIWCWSTHIKEFVNHCDLFFSTGCGGREGRGGGYADWRRKESGRKCQAYFHHTRARNTLVTMTDLFEILQGWFRICEPDLVYRVKSGIRRSKNIYKSWLLVEIDNFIIFQVNVVLVWSDFIILSFKIEIYLLWLTHSSWKTYRFCLEDLDWTFRFRCVVWTGDGRVFFYKPSTKASCGNDRTDLRVGRTSTGSFRIHPDNSKVSRWITFSIPRFILWHRPPSRVISYPKWFLNFLVTRE